MAGDRTAFIVQSERSKWVAPHMCLLSGTVSSSKSMVSLGSFRGGHPPAGGARRRWPASQLRNFRLSVSFYRTQRTGFRPVISATAGEVAACVKTRAHSAQAVSHAGCEAKAGVFDYIERYNPKRRHSASRD